MGRVDGKVIIITGGARGQGAAEAELFRNEGAQVVITDVLEEQGGQTAATLGVDFLVHDVLSLSVGSRCFGCSCPSRTHRCPNQQCRHLERRKTYQYQ